MSTVVPAAGGVPGVDVAPPAGLLRTLSRHWGFRVGALLAVMLAALAVIGPLLVHGPNVTDYASQLAPPGARHWLGTDGAGRDELARTVAGARTTLVRLPIVTGV